MAFTDVDLKDATDAIAAGAKSEDLFRLGLIYSTDIEDRGPNFVEAHKWFNLAAMMGSQPAKAYREEVRMEMSSSDIAHALRSARQWLNTNTALVRPETQFG
ncbi:MAG: hypothetical protein ACSHXY_04815 [Alphaproteobacteria bacterium]